MVDFNSLTTPQDRSMIAVAPVTVQATITPKSILSKLLNAGTITTIIPPTLGYHELNFWHTVDFIFWDAGGNLAVTGPLSISADRIVKWYFNPINQKYYPAGIASP